MESLGESLCESIYQCVLCGHGLVYWSLPLDNGGTLQHFRCPDCEETYRIREGVLDALKQPSADVLQELTGMREEMEQTHLPMEQFVIQKIPALAGFKEREEAARENDEAFNYAQANRIHFEEALQTISLHPGKRVLEIGCGSNSYFMQHFQALGNDVYGADICFRVTPAWYDKKRNSAPQRVLADMNRLPFANETFDLILISAALHHSPNIEATLKECFRLLLPGGQAMVLNEPVRGLIKHWGKNGNFAPENRNAHIHEEERPINTYHAAMKTAGFEFEKNFFPAYFDQKLLSGNTRGLRFGLLGQCVAPLWKIPALRGLIKNHGLHLAQFFFGLQMNILLRKPQSPSFMEPPKNDATSISPGITSLSEKEILVFK